MKLIPLRRLSDEYQHALRIYFDQGVQASLQPAQDLGGMAVVTGMETLDLAKVHEQALAALLEPEVSPVVQEELTRRAAVFFAEAIVPIEETHPDALAANSDLDRLSAALDQRTLDLAAAHRELQQQISGRQQAQVNLDHNQQLSKQLLEDSWRLDENLQDMARKILSATEDERKKMSLHLNDEVSQTLVGINLRLLALKKMIAATDQSLSVEITTIQRLVEDAAAIIHQLAHEFSFQYSRHAD